MYHCLNIDLVIYHDSIFQELHVCMLARLLHLNKKTKRVQQKIKPARQTILINKKTIGGIVLLNDTARIPNVAYQ